jgi:hypothetical protein
MKFKNFLKEQEAPTIRDWFEQFDVFADGHTQKNGLLYNANGPLDYADVSLETKQGAGITFDPPMESSWWHGIKSSLTLDGIGEGKITFPNFKKFPDVPMVLLTGCIVLSLEGIEHCKKITTFGFGHELEFKCGLLRLMKLPKKCKFELDASWVPEDSQSLNEQLKAALKIIDQHRNADSSIPDVMDHLIEEGYKEYAKL